MTSPENENEPEMSDSWVKKRKEKKKLYTVVHSSYAITYRSMNNFPGY